MRRALTILAMALLPFAAATQESTEPAPFSTPSAGAGAAKPAKPEIPARVIPQPIGQPADEGAEPAAETTATDTAADPAAPAATADPAKPAATDPAAEATATDTAADPATAVTPADPAATGSEPIVELTLEEDTAVPGQAVKLRLTILVPTYLPKPPTLPSYDLPNLMVRLPEKSTLPISKKIGRETWSGVQRSYVLFPLVPGEISLPGQTVTVVYADPETNKPVTVERQTEAIALTGVMPEGAEGLDPFVAASGLELTQTIDGEIADIEPGAAVVRRLAVRVEGTAPMVVPPLLGQGGQTGLSAYPEEPVVEMTFDRGAISGTRTEEVTYMAEGGGRYTLLPVALSWFNLESGKIETAEAPGVEITVTGAPAQVAGSAAAPRNLVQFLPMIAVLILCAILAARLWPPIRDAQRARRAAYRASDDWARKQALRLAGAGDYGAAVAAINLWWSRLAPGDPDLPEALSRALLDLGRERFGGTDTGSGSWQTVKREIEAAHTARKSRHDGHAPRLAPLNPVAA